MDIITWISKWFANECDGDWEHENQIRIQTVSNPGWYITIALTHTQLHHVSIELTTEKKSDDDWFFYCVKEKQFSASGDLNKLAFLLTKFKEIVLNHNSGSSRENLS